MKKGEIEINTTFIWQLINVVVLGGIIFLVVKAISKSKQTIKKVYKIAEDVEEIKKDIQNMK